MAGQDVALSNYCSSNPLSAVPVAAGATPLPAPLPGPTAPSRWCHEECLRPSLGTAANSNLSCVPEKRLQPPGSQHRVTPQGPPAHGQPDQRCHRGTTMAAAPEPLPGPAEGPGDRPPSLGTEGRAWGESNWSSDAEPGVPSLHPHASETWTPATSSSPCNQPR